VTRALLVIPRVIVGVAVLQCAATTAARSQGATSQPRLSFEVASVKQNNSATQASRISGPTPGRFTVTNVPLRFILLHAYELLDHQLIGAPEWTFSTAFDIVATYPTDNAPTDLRDKVVVIIPKGWKGSVPDLIAALEASPDAEDIVVVQQDEPQAGNEPGDDYVASKMKPAVNQQ